MYKLLIVDDEEAICSSLSFAFESDYHVFTATSEEQARKLIDREDFDIVLLDMRLGKSDGLAFLVEIKEYNKNTIVVIMTAYGSIKTSVEAMRRGAFYYITKPINTDELATLLHNAAETITLKNKVRFWSDRQAGWAKPAGMIGRSQAIREVFQLIEKVKDINTNVLITGESGTGKELAARAVHFTGSRRQEQFVVVNCAAIPEGLLESELFGHERGAFTGAVQRKIGAFEVAHRGTIFLDEICEMDINLQAKLLRAVQEREITPVGSNLAKTVDVRIICATNRDIKGEIGRGRFREDLYYRLNVINLHMPPLRERREDIPLLAGYFIDKFNKKFGKHVRQLDEAAFDILGSYAYRGNVRELENMIEHAVALTDEEYIYAEDLPSGAYIGNVRPGPEGEKLIPVFVGDDLATIEQKAILHTLRHTGGNRKETARILKISERNLRYKLKEYAGEAAKNAASENFAAGNWTGAGKNCR